MFKCSSLFVVLQDGKVDQKWKWPLGRLQTTVTVQVCLSFHFIWQQKKFTKEYNSTIGRRLHSPTVYASACVFVGITSLWRHFSRKFCFHPSHQCGESPETKKFPLIIVFCFQEGCIRVDDIQNYLWTLKRYYRWLPSWFKDDLIDLKDRCSLVYEYNYDAINWR